MRATHLLPILALSFFVTACVTQPKGTSPTGGGAATAASFPETMTFAAEADAGPVAAQVDKFLTRLEQAERWGRPLLLATVARRLSIPLPPDCAGWGQVSVVVPPAPEGTAPDVPVTRFLFAVRGLQPVDPEQVHGPEEEPEKKSADGSMNPAGAAMNHAAVITCAALIVPGTTPGRMRLGVVPVRADADWPHVSAISMVADFLLVHLAPGRGPGGDAFAWRDGHSLLFFGRGVVLPVGPWPKDAKPLPAARDFTAKLRWTAAFGRPVLLLEPTTPDTPDTADSPDTPHTADTPDTPDQSPAPNPLTPPARCAWIDGRGALTAIAEADLARLAREDGFAACADEGEARAAPDEDGEEGEELP